MVPTKQLKSMTDEELNNYIGGLQFEKGNWRRTCRLLLAIIHPKRTPY